jgi:hypothetical protein
VSARRLFAPEVVQSSAMDCGPASLKCLCEGFGVAVGYDRLREACQTDLDGTSIDTLEAVAVRLGLDAEQVMLPLDHLLIPEASALPALLVVTSALGVTHFLIVWRRLGSWVQVMDPAVGRRWMPARQLLDEAWEDASSPSFPPLPPGSQDQVKYPGPHFGTPCAETTDPPKGPESGDLRRGRRQAVRRLGKCHPPGTAC